MKNIFKLFAAVAAILSISAAANAADHHGKKHHGKKHEAAATEASAEAGATTHDAAKSKVVDKR
jgi:hypothetical protein